MHAADIEVLIDSMAMADGDVSYTDFMGHLMGAKRADEEAAMEFIFRQADRDQSGSLDCAEVVELLRSERVRKILGKRSWEDVMRMMDRDNSGRISFLEFKLALGGKEDSGSSGVTCCSYRVGDELEYFSVTQGGWIPCAVTQVSQKAVMIDVKPGAWFQTASDLQKLRRRGREP